MNTGIVLEVKNRRAVIMKTGGEFIKIKAETGWEKGDVVSLNNKTRRLGALYAAACFVLLFLTAFGGYTLYYTETSLISMDINPSLEISVNCFGKVISVTSYNEDAASLLNAENVKGLSYKQTIDTLLGSDSLRPYFEGNEYLKFAVYSKTGDTAVIKYLNSCIQSVNAAYPEIQINCAHADATIVTAAHSYHMSIGKYLAFLELQVLAPDIAADDYSHLGIGEIRNQICHQHRNGNGQEQHSQENAPESDGSPGSNSTHDSGNGHQHHGGN